MSTVRQLWASGLVLCGACSSSLVGDVDPAALGTERALAVVVDDADRPTRLLGPWDLAQPRDAVRFTSEEAALLLVGLDLADLRSQVPSLDPSGPLVPRLGTTCDGTLDGQPQRDLVLPAHAPVLRVTPEAGLVQRTARSSIVSLGDVVLRGTLDPTLCERAGEAVLQPLGPSRRLLPEGTTVEGQSPWSGMPSRGVSVVRLDRERVLVATDRAVVVFTRGESYRDEPSVARLLPTTGNAIALAMVRDGPGAAVVVGHHGNGSAPGTGGAIWDVTVGPAGIGAVTTATVVPVQLEAVARGDDGTVVAVGVDGLVLARAPGATSFRVAARLGVDLLSITATPDPRAPLLIGSADGQVLLGDARTGLFDRVQVIDSARRLDLTSVAWTQAADGVELWAGTELGLFHRPPNGAWRARPLDLPPALHRCAGASNPCGARDFVDRLTSIVVDRRGPPEAQRMWVQSMGCSGLAVLDRGSGCVGHVARDEGLVARAIRGATTRGLTLDDGVLTAVTEDGLVLELELGP